jgi:hypothetical protein
MNKEQQLIRSLNRKIISSIEIEFSILKTNFPELTSTIDDSFKRLRKTVLDSVGECERSFNLIHD